MDQNSGRRLKQRTFAQKLKTIFLRAFRLTNKPVVKLYTGFGNKTHGFIFGHVFQLSPLPRKKYRDQFILNAFALLRLFMIKTNSNAILRFEWEGKVYITKTEKDGFFKFDFQPRSPLRPGTHHVKVEMVDAVGSHVLAVGNSEIIIPHYNQYAFISDIDDTFLISYSGHLRKRLFVLLTENALTRKPFAGVVNHYQLLSKAFTTTNTTNPFFYVSSSEWNLYTYIRDFSEKNDVPKGVYLLSQVKRLKEVFRTGQNNHATKFMRITRVLEAFPELKFVLLGDDSQEDPNIYSSIATHFPHQLFSVYIRRVGKLSKPGVLSKLEQIEKSGIHCCYFTHSSEAVAHSKKIGLIPSI